MNIQPRLLSTREAAAYLGVSKTSFYAQGFSDRLTHCGWGRKKELYDIKELDQIVDEKIKSSRLNGSEFDMPQSPEEIQRRLKEAEKDAKVRRLKNLGL